MPASATRRHPRTSTVVLAVVIGVVTALVVVTALGVAAIPSGNFDPLVVAAVVAGLVAAAVAVPVVASMARSGKLGRARRPAGGVGEQDATPTP